MTLKNLIGACLYLGLQFGGLSLLAKTNKNIPPLPSEVVPQSLAPEGEKKTDILRYEDSLINPGFFTDNAKSKGFPRYFSALEMGGYLRTRFSYFRNPSLGTYIPSLRRGTSMFLPNLSVLDEALEGRDENPPQNNFSGNMRLRLDPTINISELVRVRTTIDIFDNLVLGSTPSYMNASSPVSMMSMSQTTPENSIAVKRAWAEANFPIGELRFGRMPYHFGLGLLYNSGDDISNDYGDSIDGLLFSTRVFGHYFTPGYSIAYTGPIGRGGGFFGKAANHPSLYVSSEPGQRYPLEASDLTHVFFLSMLKRENEFWSAKKQAEGKAIFEYGLLASYRHQQLDSQGLSAQALPLNTKQLVKREGNVGLMSWWMALNHKTLNIETEFSGIWGKYKVGERDTDRLGTSSRDVWLLQGGMALESKYGFMDDRLQIGLNAGLASSADGPGFGLREGSNADPKAGEADGLKSGKYKSNFKFNPAYSVDLLMYREVLGGVSGSYYLKPHISYFFSRNFGLRGDVISSFALNKENTTGNSNLMGLELDASAFLRTDSGFYFSLAYGVLFPLKGLDHRRSEIDKQNFDRYGIAKTAQTLQLYFGLLF